MYYRLLLPVAAEVKTLAGILAYNNLKLLIMRTTKLLIPVVSMGLGFVLLASCQQELACDLPEEQSLANEKNEQKDVVLSAYYNDEEGDTKTSYESANGHILWSRNDQISLFYGSGSDGGSCFTSTNFEPVQRTQFSGTIGVITGITEDTEDYYFWGVYPYNTQNSCDGTTVTTVVPHEQTGVAETFNDDEFVAIGKSAGLVMGFYNLCGAFYVKLTRSDITKITLRGKGGETLAGKVKISMGTGVPVVSEVVEGEEEVILTRPNGVAFTRQVGYFISCLPTHFSNGFYFEMETSGGLFARKEFNIDFTLGRNRFQPFNAYIDDGVTFINKVQQNNEIRYTTIDGSLLSVDAVAFSNIDNSDTDYWIETSMVSNQYINGIGIMTFDDNVVYAGINSTSPSDNRDKLLSISFPSTVTKLGSWSYCPNLSSVTVLGPLQQHYNPFTYCPNLQAFSGPNAYTYGLWNFLVVNKEAISFAPKGKTYCNISTSNITSIGRFCFSGTQVESIQLYGIESIDGYAFDRCVNLNSVLLGTSLDMIGEYAFSGCTSLNSVTLPNTLRRIGEYAFGGCSSMTNIDFPTSLKRIQAGAFYSTGLTNVLIPASVELIGESCFGNCNSLESVTVCSVTPPGFETWSDDYDSDSDYCSPFNGSYPIYVSKNSLNSYQNSANWSKYNSRLQAMNIIQFMDPTVKSICVANWDSNHDGELSQSEAEAVNSLGTVFRNTTITAFPELSAFSGLTTISNNAFFGCGQLTQIALPSTIVTIGSSAFENTNNLTQIALPSSLRTIKASAFAVSNLSEIWTLPSGVQTIGDSAFSNCKMRRMVIPNSVTSIGANAFEYCTLMTSVSLPSSLTTISTYAFTGSGITNITIPSTVTRIGLMAFANCSSLTVVNCLPTTPPTVDYTSQGLNMFYGISNFTIYVSNTSSYRSAAGWSAYQDKIKFKSF